MAQEIQSGLGLTSRSVGSQLDAHMGKTSGFDYLRIVLAVAVLCWHSYGILNGRQFVDAALSDPWMGRIIYVILPMFFALSGFLVAASLYRTPSIRTFLVFRVLRIFPALTVEICISALIFGPLLTTLPLAEYFSGRDFSLYFMNILGLVRFELPGLFENLPYARVVNGSLWTVPYELECYFYLTICMLIGVFRRRFFVVAVFVVLTIIVVQLGFTSAKGILVMLKEQLAGTSNVNANLQQATDSKLQLPRILVLSFFAGVLIYTWRNSIPFNAALAAVAGVLGFYLLQPELYFYSPLPLAYLTVWLGLQTPAKLPYLFSGDYSYGVYLYAFPIQQAVLQTGLVRESYIAHVVVSLLLTFGLAVMSWHFIEKPFLKLKSLFLAKGTT